MLIFRSFEVFLCELICMEDLYLNFLLKDFEFSNFTVFEGSYSQKMFPFLFFSATKRLWVKADDFTCYLFYRSSCIFRYILFPLNFRLSFCSKSYFTVVLHSFINSISRGKPDAGSVAWLSVSSIANTFFWLFLALMISVSLSYGIVGLTKGKKQVMKNTNIKSWAPIILLPFLMLRRALSSLQRWFKSKWLIYSYISSSRMAILPSESNGKSNPLSLTLKRF